LKAAEIRFFRGRLKFCEGHVAPRNDQNAAPFPSMLVIYRKPNAVLSGGSPAAERKP
jgi:hypothetical protein